MEVNQQGVLNKIWLPYGLLSCQDEQKLGYSVPDLGYIIICDEGLPPRMLATIGDDRTKDFMTIQDAHLEKLMTTSQIILHELFHLFYTYTSEPSVCLCFVSRIGLIFVFTEWLRKQDDKKSMDSLHVLSSLQMIPWSP